MAAQVTRRRTRMDSVPALPYRNPRSEHGGDMGALNGIRIIDFARILAGPWATQLLADLGAEVIKIERPGQGDDTRSWGPPFLATPEGEPLSDAAYFCCTNRNKKSVAIDITDARGQELVKALTATADVVVENFKVGGLKKYGLDYAGLKAVKPDLIYCSITGFGQDGPRAEEAGYDLLMQGMGGLMSVTGKPDSEAGGGPVKVGVALVDVITGLYASNAILAALRHRDATGEGQYIDLALLDSLVAALANQSHGYLVSGKIPPRLGNAHPSIAPYEAFATADGHMILAVGNDDQFRRFAAAAGHPEWGSDPKYRTNKARVQHRGELIPMLGSLFRSKPSRYWIDLLSAQGIPCGPINTLDAVFADPQVKHREVARTLPHAAAGTVPTIANPIRLSATPAEYRMGPPVLGEHTSAVLRALLKLDDTSLAALSDAGAIQK
jgi:crotonobetainyl-CoA:carnitine CoA-transferase CaiB-like acyl-CoA transferase